MNSLLYFQRHFDLGQPQRRVTGLKGDFVFYGTCPFPFVPGVNSLGHGLRVVGFDANGSIQVPRNLHTTGHPTYAGNERVKDELDCFVSCLRPGRLSGPLRCREPFTEPQRGNVQCQSSEAERVRKNMDARKCGAHTKKRHTRDHRKGAVAVNGLAFFFTFYHHRPLSRASPI